MGAVRQSLVGYVVGFVLLGLTALLCFVLNQRVTMRGQRTEEA